MSVFARLDEVPELRLVEELLHRAKMRYLGKCDYCGRYANDPSCKYPERHALAQRSPVVLSGGDQESRCE